jgi:zinc protease
VFFLRPLFDPGDSLEALLRANLDISLALYADVILNPSFPENEFKRLKAQTLAAIQQEKAEPFSIALRVFPKLL